MSPRETVGCVLRHSYRVIIKLAEFYTVLTNVITEYVSHHVSVCPSVLTTVYQHLMLHVRSHNMVVSN